jgi:hypothetical protein
MAITGYINFARNAVTAEQISQDGWVNAGSVQDAAIEYNSVADNTPTGISFTFVGYAGNFPGTLGSELAGTGAASWAPAGSLRGGVGAPSGWEGFLRHSGLDDAKLYNIKFTGSIDIPGRVIAFSSDGTSTVKTLECYDSTAELPSNDAAVEFIGLSPTAGVIDIQWKKGAGSGYLSAVGIEEQTLDPAVTTTDTLQPGESFTLTATNYASAPVSPVTLTPLDENGDAITGITPITVAVTITGSGPYTATGTMPTLAEAVTAGNSIPFGSTRISLST